MSLCGTQKFNASDTAPPTYQSALLPSLESRASTMAKPYQNLQLILINNPHLPIVSFCVTQLCNAPPVIPC